MQNAEVMLNAVNARHASKTALKQTKAIRTALLDAAMGCLTVSTGTMDLIRAGATLLGLAKKHSEAAKVYSKLGLHSSAATAFKRAKMPKEQGLAYFRAGKLKEALDVFRKSKLYEEAIRTMDEADESPPLDLLMLRAKQLMRMDTSFGNAELVTLLKRVPIDTAVEVLESEGRIDHAVELLGDTERAGELCLKHSDFLLAAETFQKIDSSDKRVAECYLLHCRRIVGNSRTIPAFPRLKANAESESLSE
jgi:tetratricopeptide (TPR) repeat protein